MIAPGTLCRLRNPMGNAVVFQRNFQGEPDLIDPEKYLFTIIAIPVRFAGSTEHFAWGLLHDGRLGFINCKWLIEVREGDE